MFPGYVLVDAGAGYEMGRTDDLEVFGPVEDAGFDLCAGGCAGHVIVNYQ